MHYKTLRIAIIEPHRDSASNLFEGLSVQAVDMVGGNIFHGIAQPKAGIFTLELPAKFEALWIQVEKKTYISQRRYFNFHFDNLNLTFLLFKSNTPFYYQQSAQLPYTITAKNTIGFILESTDLKICGEVDELCQRLKLSRLEGQHGLYEIDTQNAQSKAATILTLRDNKNLLVAGPVMKIGTRFKIFSGKIFIRTLSHLALKTQESLLKKWNKKYKLLEPMLKTGKDIFTTSISSCDTAEINELIAQLNREEGIAYAYGDWINPVTSTTVITPNDYIFKDDWEKAAVKLPEAWHKLESNLGNNYKYGNPNIITAIMDSGIQSINGIVLNPDLNNGVAKSTTYLHSAANAGASFIEITTVIGINIGDFASIGLINGTTETLEINNISSIAPGITRLDFVTNLTNSYALSTIVDINRKPKIYQLYNFTGTAFTNNGNAYPANNDDLNAVQKSWTSYGMPSDHGTAVAGIVAAGTNNKAALGNKYFGTLGAAPNTRLIGLVAPAGNFSHARSIEWIAGLDANADPNEATIGNGIWPSIIQPGADIYNASLGLGENDMMLDARAKLAIDRATSRGRNGRGMALFLSSGNDDVEFGSPAALFPIAIYYSYANYERVIMVGNSNKNNERTSGMGGSNWGTNLDFCAPGTWIKSSTIFGKGGTPTFSLLSKQVMGPAVYFDPNSPTDKRSIVSASTKKLQLNNVTGLVKDSWASIFDNDNKRQENVYIRKIIGGPQHEIEVTSVNPYITAVNAGSAGTVQDHITKDDNDSSIKCTLVVDSKLIGLLTVGVTTGDTVLTVSAATNPNLSVDQELIIGISPMGNGAAAWLWRRERVVVTGASTANGTNWDIPVTAIAGTHPATTTQVIISYAYARGDFGGTSAASPLAAGIGALVLGAKPSLTWVELRHILRSTAVLHGPFLDMGYGVLDAATAVQAAIDYTHDERDLIIRNNLDDIGKMEALPIISPDIWVRNLEAADDDVMTNAATLNFTKEGPHHQPYHDKDRWIYARIKNRGTTETNLDAWVRFYIALSDGQLPAGEQSLFPWPSAWEEAINADPINTTTTAGTYFLGEVKINEGDIAAGGNKVIPIFWPLAKTPALIRDPNAPAGAHADYQLSNGLKVYLLVEITPHDGLFSDNRVHKNNNLSYREIVFTEGKEAEAFFRDVSGENILPVISSVDDDGDDLATDFKLEIEDIEAFDLQTVGLALKILQNNVWDTFNLSYNGTTWTGTPSIPLWFTIANNPTKTVGHTTNGYHSKISFDGSFTLNNTHQELEMEATFTYDQYNDAGVLVNNLQLTQNHNLCIKAGLLESGLEADDFAKPRLHIFADLLQVDQPQLATHTFGPVVGNETTKFRITSSFTASQKVKAYAAMAGRVMIQAEGADRINLILRPDYKPSIRFNPIKYFVYRGLKKDQFLDSNNSSQIIPQTDPNLSEFISDLHTAHASRFPSGSTIPPIKAEALGLESNQSSTLLLDTFFHRDDLSFQLPVVKKGMHLGDFYHDGGYAFGFEIILEEGIFQPDLNYARRPSYEVEIDNNSSLFEKKATREKIRYFVDPAAFYGQHYYSGVTIPGTNAPLKDAALYSNVVSKFATKHKVYISIFNENAYSLNYYGNYDGASGTTDQGKHLKLQTTGATPMPQEYKTNEWPIIILEEPSAIPTTANPDFNLIKCYFKFLDNQSPLLFVEIGDPEWIEAEIKAALNNLIYVQIKRDLERNFVPKAFWKISNTLPHWGNNFIEFKIPVHPDPNDASKVFNVAQLIKLHLLRTEAPATWDTKVVQNNDYYDNLFGPLDLNALTIKKFLIFNKKIEWFELQSKKYIDGYLTTNISREFPYKYMASRGAAFDKVNNKKRLIFWATQSTMQEEFNGSDTPPISFSEGFDEDKSFFHLNQVFTDLKLFVDIIKENDTGGNEQEIKVLSFKELPGNVNFREEVLWLALLQPEFNQLKNLNGLDATIHERYIAFDEQLPVGSQTHFNDLTVGSPKKYFKFKLGIQGLDNSGVFQKIFPAAGNEILVYSIDKRTFCSKEFAEHQEGVADVSPTFEENTVLRFAQPDIILALDSTIDADVTALETAIDLSNIPEDKNAKDAILQVVRQYGQDIFEHSWTRIQASAYANPDDRQLYWGRLKMRIALRNHPALSKSEKDLNEVINELETFSRGYNAVNFTSSNPAFQNLNINFSTIKKILLIGFDPFGILPTETSILPNNIYQGNTAGASALAWHNAVIKDGTGQVIGLVQAAIFPVRYADFDQDGGTGIVEAYFAPYINDIDLGLSMSLLQTMDLENELHVDRFAARTRGNNRAEDMDNNGEVGSAFYSTFPSNIQGDNFIETNLPITDIVPTAANNTGAFKIFYNQNFEFIDASKQVNRFEADTKKAGNAHFVAFDSGDKKIETTPRHTGIEGQTPAELTPTALQDTKPVKGSGGSFLSNEVFYRISVLRNDTGTNAQTGHFHLPMGQALHSENENTIDDFDALRVKQIIELVGELIKKAIE